MTIETLFGTESVADKPRTIKFKQIKAVYETLVVHEEISNYLKTGQRYTSPSQVYETFRFLINEIKEMFICLHLDGKNRILCTDIVSMGSLNQSIVHPRSVFQTACLSSAAAIICVHNHPSGDPTPSSEDISITRRLKEAGEIMGIKILDHIIVGDNDFCSFVEKGLM
ncbi:DNA repair protein RadC [Trichlorobacter lovleyi]|uniref:RadC family protein n=1 Tax=Trichlorobacter lovleyi TaxID=313985 RepID=UPI002480150D|nr:DNA repair protein RadC [Trichlorobacter lovleyi]